MEADKVTSDNDEAGDQDERERGPSHLVAPVAVEAVEAVEDDTARTSEEGDAAASEATAQPIVTISDAPALRAGRRQFVFIVSPWRGKSPFARVVHQLYLQRCFFDSRNNYHETPTAGHMLSCMFSPEDAAQRAVSEDIIRSQMAAFAQIHRLVLVVYHDHGMSSGMRRDINVAKTFEQCQIIFRRCGRIRDTPQLRALARHRKMVENRRLFDDAGQTCHPARGKEEEDAAPAETGLWWPPRVVSAGEPEAKAKATGADAGESGVSSVAETPAASPPAASPPVKNTTEAPKERTVRDVARRQSRRLLQCAIGPGFDLAALLPAAR